MASWMLAFVLGLGALPGSSLALAETAPLQTVAYLGGVLGAGQPIGTLDTTTDFSLDGGATWQPAYLVGTHPWGLVPGTNSWINCGPTTASCLNRTVDYRVRFVVPAGFSNPTIGFQVKADNAGTLFLNGTQISPRFEGEGLLAPVSVTSSLVVGTNTLIVRVEDWGGLAGFNYRADLTMNAPAPIVTVPPASPIPTAPSFSQGLAAPAGALACTPLLMNNQAGFTAGASTQHWFVRASGTTLAVDVSAVTVNNATESGRVIADLYDGATAVPGGHLEVVHPNTLGGTATATLGVPSVPGRVYRLAITTGTPDAGDQPARHYRLRFNAADAAGVQSPGLLNYEGGPARWGVNVNASEELRVRVGDSNVDALHGSANLITPALASQPSVALASPGTNLVVASPAAVGQWLAAINPEHHYTLDKTSGSDRGLYLTWLTAGEGSVAINVSGQPVELTFTDLSGQVQTQNFPVGTTTMHLPVGPYTVTAAAPAPGTYQVAPATASVNVTCDGTAQLAFKPVNRPPTVSLNGPSIIPEGTGVNLGALANDPDGDPLTFTWTLAGPGTLTPSGGTATYANGDGPANATVTVTVTDPAGLTASANLAIQTRNVPPTLVAGPDQTQYWGLPVPLTVVSVTDPSQQDAAAGFTIDWHFGDPPSPAPDQSGLDLLATSHAYALPGPYVVKVAATDKDGGRGPQSADTIGVTVTTRPTAISCTTVSAPFGSATLSANLADTIDAPSALLGGRTVTFTVGAATHTAVTGAGGAASVSAGTLLPGTYAVTVAVAGNSLYDGATATCTLTITNTAGKVTAGTLRSANNGRGGFNVQSDGSTVKGELQFQNGAINFHAHTLTALAVSADRTKAWFAGVGVDGRAFTAYVEDNGEPGRTDVFKLWIAGVPQNGDGALTGGNVQIHK